MLRPPKSHPPTLVDGSYDCPHCGEEIVVPVDPSAGPTQAYVEDCPVCCSPIVLRVEFDERGRPLLTGEPE